MKLYPRLTLLTVSLVSAIMLLTVFAMAASLRFFLRSEFKSNQLIWFSNFRDMCADSIRKGDAETIRLFSESLEHSIPELDAAVFVFADQSEKPFGGASSIDLYERLRPFCLDDGQRRAPFFEEIRTPSDRWRFYCQQVNVGDRHGTVFMGFNINVGADREAQVFRHMARVLLLPLVLVMALGVLGAWYVAARLTGPILSLSEGAKAIGDGQLDTRIPVNSRDELGFLAEEFNLMAAKLKELDQLKDQFVSSVSHELRSPLSAISGYVELLRSKPLDQFSPERREKAFSVIQESTERLTHFINEILDLTKLKAGHVELRIKEVRPREVMEDVLHLFHALIDNKQISATVAVEKGAETVRMDEQKLRQILINLFSNALKFTPVGGRIQMTAKKQGENHLFSVQDSGPGISPEDQRSIFDRFWQGHAGAHSTMGVKGTGLGLAISKGYVELHGGRIWVDSVPPDGATFHFSIPDPKAEG